MSASITERMQTGLDLLQSAQVHDYQDISLEKIEELKILIKYIAKRGSWHQHYGVQQLARGFPIHMLK